MHFDLNRKVALRARGLRKKKESDGTDSYSANSKRSFDHKKILACTNFYRPPPPDFWDLAVRLFRCFKIQADFVQLWKCQ